MSKNIQTKKPADSFAITAWLALMVWFALYIFKGNYQFSSLTGLLVIFLPFVGLTASLISLFKRGKNIYNLIGTIVSLGLGAYILLLIVFGSFIFD